MGIDWVVIAIRLVDPDPRSHLKLKFEFANKKINKKVIGIKEINVNLKSI